VIAITSSRRRRQFGTRAIMLRRLHVDGMLFAGVAAVLVVGLAALYSAVGQNGDLVINQLVRMLAALAGMLIMAQVEPGFLRRTSPWVYALGLILLGLVLITGDVGKGAQRWLDIGVRFQPSEIMKIGLPMMLAWLLRERPLPPSFGMIAAALGLTLLPVAMIALQPDLGTAILIALTGATVVFLSGIGLAYIVTAVCATLISLPVLWYFVMHDYQKSRVLTLINPDSDPLGAGYHIMQSKIAIGSGGLFGKGWLNGSQGQLEFLPERSTDFIFAIIGEEFGLMGALAVLLIYLFIVGRGLAIAVMAQDTFSRLLAGSISLTFFFYVFVNTAMVTGLIPVVGVPLPLISAGGTSMVTLLAGFGILMSIQTHRKLLAR
jgi:rod shape determining protein RodA